MSTNRTPDRTDEPRWLDADERAAWLGLAGVITLLPAALDAQLERDAGLSHFEYMVLAMLSERPSRTARMSEIAALANGSLSRLSHVARRLEGRGLLERSPCIEDRRATVAVLTDDGYAAVVAAAPGHVEEVRRLVFDALGSGQAGQLRAIAEQILGRVNPGVTCPS